jgi:hypothetical protein
LPCKRSLPPQLGEYALVTLELNDVENAQSSPQMLSPHQNDFHVAVTDEATSAQYDIAPMKPVGYLTSLKSQLYMISFILLVGMVITMIVTVTKVQNEGETWTCNYVD